MMKKLFVIGSLLCILTGCQQTLKEKVMKERVEANAKREAQYPDIATVQDAQLPEYPNIPFLDAFETFYLDPKWTQKKNIVIFTGKFDLAGKRATARWEFVIVDDRTFEFGDLYYNDIIQTEEERELMLKDLFTSEYLTNDK